MPTVVVEGDFVFPNSALSIANRGLFGALSRRAKYDLTLLCEPSAGRIPEEAVHRVADVDVVIRHLLPAATSQHRHKAYVHIQPWEFGALPKRWAEEWHENVDEIWCYSSHVRDTYVQAGFSHERVHVVPLGFDPAFYTLGSTPRTIPTQRRCVFLFVGGTVVWKGVDLVLAAWQRAFKPTDDVALVIKDVPWYAQRPTAQIMQLASCADVAELLYTEEMFPGDDAMAALYRSATCLVQPYRGESFCLPVLEAMACGTPAIVTRGGATDDFFTAECGYPVEAKRMLSPPPLGEELAGAGWWLEPDIEQIAAAMRKVYEDPGDAQRRGRNAAAHALAGWTWAHAATRAEERLDALVSRTRDALPHTAEVPSYASPINRFEGKYFSQNGEDGMILEIFRQLQPAQHFFVEFGVQSGVECNTRNLAVNHGWSGVMLEGDPSEFERLTQTYKQSPGVRTVQAFITRENVRQTFAAANIPYEFELLSIDIDGNDYWIWEEIATAHRPTLVIVEINGVHKPPKRWVMEYNPAHIWQRDSYYGASLQSLSDLGKRLGYSLLGVERAGVNAFFLRDDALERSGFPVRTPKEAWRPPRWIHRERAGPFLEI